MRSHLDLKRPVLLAFSGGPDSMALFLLLLEFKKRYPLDLHLLHIDHGWRASSHEEALWLQKLVMQEGIPFYLKTLPPPTSWSNIEERYREMRLECFSELCRERGFQAVLLGHHADDQAETILKRVFEGAHLWSLPGLQEESTLVGCRFLRPLLAIPKKELLSFLEKKGAQWIEDPTNRDPRCLRARMRTQLIPELSALFGKEIRNPLCTLAKEAKELQEYLEVRTSAAFNQLKKQGSCSLQQLLPLDIKYLLKKSMRSTPSRAQLALLVKKERCTLTLHHERVTREGDMLHIEDI